MNSADRSIAILDLAVRRRFAFVDIWPDLEVVQEQGLGLATEAFGKLQDIFAQHAPDDALVLMPGHAYLLAEDESLLARRLQYELIPLLIEYLQEGRLGPCETELEAYIDWLHGEVARGAAHSQLRRFRAGAGTCKWHWRAYRYSCRQPTWRVRSSVPGARFPPINAARRRGHECGCGSAGLQSAWLWLSMLPAALARGLFSKVLGASGLAGAEGPVLAVSHLRCSWYNPKLSELTRKYGVF